MSRLAIDTVSCGVWNRVSHSSALISRMDCGKQLLADQVGGVALNCRRQLLHRTQPVHEVEAERLRRRHLAAGEHQVERIGMAHHLPEDPRYAVFGHQAEPSHRVVQRAAYRLADGREQRVPSLVVGTSVHVEEAPLLGDQLGRVHAAKHADIHTGAEGVSCSGKHGDAHGRICLGLQQSLHQTVIERFQLIGTVEHATNDLQ